MPIYKQASCTLNGEILISAKIPKNEVSLSILHEMLHEISRAFSLSLDEREISTLEIGLYEGLIRGNPEILSYICGRDHASV